MKKIDKKLYEFTNIDLKKLLVRYTPAESSLGIWGRNIMISDFISQGDLIMAIFNNERLNEELLYKKLLYETSMDYVKCLKNYNKVFINISDTDFYCFSNFIKNIEHLYVRFLYTLVIL
ncbi:hypothetical protein [Streptococcus massiliensis]|uniref:Uncharacterized protein n=1 Tax=Streptococcus massiliensis TaxID=313439 RepID=A0A380KZK2_9STRE|nr:hypothetical protein [Streptococcus massiliensis]SUN76524.1 Uncharacterised protein [Streptococcus massiliensis]